MNAPDIPDDPPLDAVRQKLRMAGLSPSDLEVRQTWEAWALLEPMARANRGRSLPGGAEAAHVFRAGPDQPSDDGGEPA